MVVRLQMVVDRFDKKLRDTLSNVRSFIYHFSCKSQRTILCHTMLHTKTIVIDGIWSSIGSCNIDDRSFLLNYECNAVVYGRFFGNAMEEMFEEDLVDCEEIALERWRKRSWWKRLRNKLLIPFTKQL